MIDWNVWMEVCSLGSKSSKQTDEKKEKGTAQILVPSRLIFAGKITRWILRKKRIFFSRI